MITYHEFLFPIEPKYLPGLKVIKQPCARIAYRLVDETEIEITEIGFHPIILIHFNKHSDFFAEIEQAAKEHYKDLEQEAQLEQYLKPYTR